MSNHWRIQVRVCANPFGGIQEIVDISGYPRPICSKHSKCYAAK